jgi:membrane-bound ClpP family serine protease
MLTVRYLLPLFLFLGGLVLLLIEPNTIGVEGFAMATGAALSVLLLNWLFRAGVRGDRERQSEEDAREHFARHGRWPDDDA